LRWIPVADDQGGAPRKSRRTSLRIGSA